jgi:hypothetical protein
VEVFHDKLRFVDEVVGTAAAAPRSADPNAAV